MHTIRKIVFMLLIMPMSFNGFSKTIKVKILNDRFDPAAISACEGDTVTWNNLSGNSMELVTGSKCKADGLFNSGNIIDGKEFTYIFSKQGNYTYFTPNFCSKGMRGLVMVNPKKLDTGKAKNFEQSQPKKSSSLNMEEERHTKTQRQNWNTVNKQIYALKPKELLA